MYAMMDIPTGFILDKAALHDATMAAHRIEALGHEIRGVRGIAGQDGARRCDVVFIARGELHQLGYDYTGTEGEGDVETQIELAAEQLGEGLDATLLDRCAPPE